jgi:hypothetical protein
MKKMSLYSAALIVLVIIGIFINAFVTLMVYERNIIKKSFLYIALFYQALFNLTIYILGIPLIANF